MLWLIFVSVIFLCIYIKVKRSHSYWKKKDVDHVKPMFLFGNINLFTRKSIYERIINLYKQFPDTRYHGCYQFLDPVLVLKDPELIKEITVKEFDSFLDHRPFVPADVDPFWNRNLFAATGEKWRDLRTTLSPSFTSSKMKMMFNLIEECAKHFTEYFEQEAGNSDEIQELEMKDIVTRYTNDVIATTAFGLKCDSLKNKTNDFYMTGKDATNFRGFRILKFALPALSPFLCKMLNFKLISDKTVNYFTKIISETIQTREKNSIIRPDMIHLLMEAQKGREKQEDISNIDEGFATVQETTLLQSTNKKRPITMDDIVSQAFIFFFAGFETVSTAMSFALYELAINPDIQTRLRNDILEVDSDIKYEKILNIKYLDMVISEVLRKWTPTIITDRKVTKPYTIQPTKPGEKPLHLDEGVVCWLPLCAIHRDPKFYPDPHRFDPERFSDENKHKINPMTYMPFGVGPRNCIGSRFALLEIKLLVYHTLRKFEIVPIKRSPIPMDLDPFVMAPKNGMWLGLRKRK